MRRSRDSATRDAFVSYAARDAREAAALSAGLEALGVRLWIDTEMIPRARSTWREAVHAGIAGSRAVLVVLSEHWMLSPACRYELAIALDRRTRLVAVATLPGLSSNDHGLPESTDLVVAGAVAERVALVGARLVAARRP